MEQFYYQRLPANGVVFGAVAYVEDRPAGFAAATANSAGFIRAAVARHRVELARVLVISLLESSDRMNAARHLLRFSGRRQQPRKADTAGEILSFGVLPDFLSPSFVAATRLRIALDLFDHVMTALRTKGAALCHRSG